MEKMQILSFFPLDISLISGLITFICTSIWKHKNLGDILPFLAVMTNPFWKLSSPHCQKWKSPLEDQKHMSVHQVIYSKRRPHSQP